MTAPSTFFDDLRFHIDEDNLPVRAEQLRARLKLLPLLLTVQVLIEPFFVWLMWDVAPHQQLLIWLAVAYLLHLAEAVLWFQRREYLDTVDECLRWSQDVFNLALVFGMMWGVGTLFFFPGDLLTQVLLVSVLMGLTAGAATMNSMHPPAFHAYVLGLMVPLIFRVMVEQDETHIALGVMLLLFLLVTLSSGHFMSKFIMLSLRQRFENELLAQQLASMNGMLEHKVQERTAQLQHKTEEVSQIRDATIMAMASLAETRDDETGNHLRRTQKYIRSLGIQLRDQPRFRDFLTEDNIESMYKLAPLHDIGKVGIPDAILLKEGKLTPEEFETMKLHPQLGGNAIAVAESGLPTPSRFLHIAREIANGHHEKWDGSVYPLGLQGDALPISARLMAVSDVYDALISRRIYKQPLTHEEAVAYILQGKGKHFDPDVADAFYAIQEEFGLIAEQYQD